MWRFCKSALRWIHRRYFTSYGFFSGYDDWRSAERATNGYDDPGIIKRSTDAAEQVLAGRAAFERDSVLFDEPEYSWPLLAALNHAAAEIGTRSLNVLDFGGGAGSTYMQHRQLLPAGTDWAIVEQEGFVEWGLRARHMPSALSFHADLDSGLQGRTAHVILFSSVLQYLEDPDAWIAECKRREFRYVILDLVLCQDREGDRVCVQHVPPSIYQGSYPVRCFAWRPLLRKFLDEYRLLADFDAYIGNPSFIDRRDPASYRGACFIRK